MVGVIVERSMSPQFLSNSYLVSDGQGGPAFFVDAGGPAQPLIDAADKLGLEPTHVLLTHHHFDHVAETRTLCERWPALQVLAHPLEREQLGELTGSGIEVGALQSGQSLRFGALEVRALHTPGHTAGMLSLLVCETAGQPESRAGAQEPAGIPGGGAAVFTGDTLFEGSVGGVRAPGHTTYADLRDSIMGTLMELPPQTVVYPGHTEATTVGREWETNPFIRVWRGLDREGADRCTALGQPATLILLAPDYDGGTKAWVRWADGSDDIVPGSRVETTGRD